MKNIEELKEQLKLLQDIISAYETLNKLKRESIDLDRKEYIPYPVYPYGTGTPWQPPYYITCGTTNTYTFDKDKIADNITLTGN